MKKLWIKIIAGAVPGAAVFLLLSILLIRCLCRRKEQKQIVSAQNLPQAAGKFKPGNIHAGINKFHLSYKSGRSLRFHNLNHHHRSPAFPPPSPFNWEENPRFIAEAVETGWPRFAFSAPTPRASSGSEIGWEIPSNSSEFMQTVKLNTLPNRTAENPSLSWVRTSLPLPGPALGGGAFPQEAYFEITILYLRKKLQSTASKRVKNHERDRAKLIRENSGAGIMFASQEPILHPYQGNSGDVTVSLGLISSGAASLGQAKPGTFPGSIGFHSNGSVFLDGKSNSNSRMIFFCNSNWIFIRILNSLKFTRPSQEENWCLNRRKQGGPA
ncbi:hypothetical protein KSP40_PGU021909 [Platanthera guangdongensis]|uniref:Uncharacterized protein n=1 Tax=Platanthera guangdongensis TaxID=2320717 RepID=A0ABR2LUV0_9ASPA